MSIRGRDADDDLGLLDLDEEESRVPLKGFTSCDSNCSPPAKKPNTSEEPLHSHELGKMGSKQWAKQKKKKKDRRSSHPECLPKDPEYKMFTPEMELEKSIFAKCSFAKPEPIEVAPLQENSRPPQGMMDSKTIKYLQVDQRTLNHFWDKDPVLIKALHQYLFTQGVLEGKTQWVLQWS